jgi:large subunit ribosomal protein L18
MADNAKRLRRKRSIRKNLNGTTERPRLTVYRSLKHIYAQVVDDEKQCTVAAVSTAGKANAETYSGLKKAEQAEKAGKLLAEKCKAAGIESVVFDRNGYKYHGRVKALASGAREGGLQF